MWKKMEWTSETISFSLLWLTILCFQHTQGFWEIHIGFDSLLSTHRSSSTSHNHSYHLFSSINTLIQTITLNTPHPNLLSLLQQQLQITFPTIWNKHLNIPSTNQDKDYWHCSHSERTMFVDRVKEFNELLFLFHISPCYHHIQLL